MKNIILWLFTIGIISCNSENTPKNISQMNDTSANRYAQNFELQQLEGYFLKNDISLEKDVNSMVFSTEEEFNAYFGVAKTMNNTVPPIDFNTERVAAILITPTNLKIDFSIINTQKTGTELQVVYTLIKGKKQSFTTAPVYLFKIPKNNTLQSIEFVYDNDHNIIAFPSKE
ncbi:MAG: hypothetical protein ACK5MD_06665 [Flavobacteriales bacterium]